MATLHRGLSVSPPRRRIGVKFVEVSDGVYLISVPAGDCHTGECRMQPKPRVAATSMGT